MFPPVVTGTIILVIGISLMRVGVNWAGGGLPTLTKVIDGQSYSFANPAYGALDGLAIAFFVLVVILLLTKFGRGFVGNIAVLLGIVAGSVLASLLGKMSFAKVGEAPLFGLVYPFQFGLPTFDLIAVLTMCLVMVVVMIESTGMFLALGDMTGRRVDQDALTKGLRADGVGTVVGGVFNTFPYTSFSQNVGLVGVTGVRSRWVTATGGVIMLLLGLMPKMSALVEAVPVVVLGGAGLVMFGMVAATGARILGAVDFRNNRHNLFIVALSIGFGMIPLVAPGFFKQMPHALHPLLESGILLAAIVAVLLNAFFNGVGSAEEARTAAAATTHGAEA
jgi:NCS2 family nucleobase:cation symporter-2